MRIIAGRYKNHSIQAPRSRSIEPVPEMIRETAFNVLGDEIVDACVADFFAGSGSFGLEALSRGAQRVTFIDKKREAVRAVTSNSRTLQLNPDTFRVWHNDVLQIPYSESEWARWNLVFMDPPRVISPQVLLRLHRRRILDDGCLLVVHRPVDCERLIGSPPLQLLDQRSYGKGELSFWRVAS